MTKLHLIAIPFTGVGLHGGFRGDDWYWHRIDIFKNYTLKSLANQSNKDFVLWCWFRPEEEFNPLTREIERAVEEAGLRYIFTFNGLMYHDDKFSNYNIKTKLHNLAQMLLDGFHQGHKPLKELWKYTWENKNKTLLSRLTESLKKIGHLLGTGYDWVYLTRIDSDDMFHRDAVATIQNCEMKLDPKHFPHKGVALTFQNGYMYNVVTDELADWIPPTNPPFHTIIFPQDVFFDAEKHKKYYRYFKSHEDIPKVFNTFCLDDHQYCVTAHGKDHISTAWSVPIAKQKYQKVKYYSHTTSGKNISTRWESRVRHKKNIMLGKEYYGEEKTKILEVFGV